MELSDSPGHVTLSESEKCRYCNAHHHHDSVRRVVCIFSSFQERLNCYEELGVDSASALRGIVEVGIDEFEDDESLEIGVGDGLEICTSLDEME